MRYFLLFSLLITGCSSAPATTSKPTASPPTSTATPTWRVEITSAGPLEQFSKVAPTLPQGRVVVIEIRVTNLGNQPASFTRSAFSLLSQDGRTFSPSDFSGNLQPGLGTAQQAVQPGLTSAHRLAFDVDPALKAFTLVALGSRVPVALP